MDSNLNIDSPKKNKGKFRSAVDKFIRGTQVNKFNKNEEHSYKIREKSYFLNAEHQAEFIENGYVVFKDVIKSQEINDLKNGINLLINQGLEFGGEFVNVGCVPNIEWRNITRDVIAKHSKSIFSRMLDVDQIEFNVSGSYVLKPIHEDSALEIHQDASFIDEDLDYSLYMWIPFVNIGSSSGSLYALPGSHLWGNTQRGFGVPWQLDPHTELMKEYSKPIYLNIGDAILFDSALVHGSTKNFSKERRDALVIAVVRKNPDLVYYHQFETSNGTVLKKYKVNSTFFDAHDYVSEPDENLWPSDIVKLKDFNLSKGKMIKLIERYLPIDKN